MSKEHYTDKFFCKNHLLNDTQEPECPITKLKLKIYNKFGIWNFLDIVPITWRYFYYDYIKPIFRPCHQKLRKSVPKTWVDLSEVLEIVNFQIIKSFYEEEYLAGIVDWEGTSEKHKEFAQWLESAYKYITEERPALEKQRDDSYPDSRPFNDCFKESKDSEGRRVFQYVSLPGSYEDHYGEVDRLEKLIDDKDTEILIALIKNRDYLWT